MLKNAETVFFLIAVTVALALPALPLLQELRPGDAARHARLPTVQLERVVIRASEAPASALAALDR